MKRNPTPTEEAKRQKLAGEVLSVWRDLILAIEDTYAGEQMLSMIPAGRMRTEAEHLQENARLDLYNIINAYSRCSCQKYFFTTNYLIGMVHYILITKNTLIIFNWWHCSFYIF